MLNGKKVYKFVWTPQIVLYDKQYALTFYLLVEKVWEKDDRNNSRRIPWGEVKCLLFKIKKSEDLLPPYHTMTRQVAIYEI